MSGTPKNYTRKLAGMHQERDANNVGGFVERRDFLDQVFFEVQRRCSKDELFKDNSKINSTYQGKYGEGYVRQNQDKKKERFGMINDKECTPETKYPSWSSSTRSTINRSIKYPI